MSAGKIPLTSEGFETLKAEIKQRKGADRQSIIKAIAEARAHGDLKENAEYHAAKEMQGLNESRIGELEGIMSRANVIDVSKLSGEQVTFGATVTIVDEDTDQEVTYKIVGEFEAEIKNGKISVTSPVARALIGKKVGDSIEVNTPGGGKFYELLKIVFR